MKLTKANYQKFMDEIEEIKRQNDNLTLLLEAEKCNHKKDNEYFLKEIKGLGKFIPRITKYLMGEINRLRKLVPKEK